MRNSSYVSQSGAQSLPRINLLASGHIVHGPTNSSSAQWHALLGNISNRGPLRGGGAERQEERQMRGGSYSLHFRTVQVIVRRRKMDCCCMPLKPFDSGQFLARTPSSLFYKG